MEVKIMKFLLCVFLGSLIAGVPLVAGASLSVGAECVYETNSDHLNLNTVSDYETSLMACVNSHAPHAGVPMVISTLRLDMMKLGIIKNKSNKNSPSPEAIERENKANQKALKVGEEFRRVVWNNPRRKLPAVRSLWRKIVQLRKARDVVATQAGLAKHHLVVMADDLYKLSSKWHKASVEYFDLLEPKVRVAGLWSFHVYYKWRKNLEKRTAFSYQTSVPSTDEVLVYSLVDDVVARGMKFQSLLADSQKQNSLEAQSVKQRKTQIEKDIMALKEEWYATRRELETVVQNLKAMDIQATQLYAQYYESLGPKVLSVLAKKEKADSEWRAVTTRPLVRYYYGTLSPKVVTELSVL